MKKTCLTIGILLCGLMAFQHMLPYKKISPEQINIAVQKSLHRLEYSSHDFLANAGGCHSCHGQALGSIAFFMANEKGFNVSKPEWQEAIDSMSNSIHRNRSAYIECTDPVALAIGRGYDLWALSVNQVKPNKDIHLLVRDLLTRQSLNGSWASPSSRPPMEGSTYTATALASYGIQAYAPPVWKEKVKVSIDKARNWLEMQSPYTNEEKIFQLLGLLWTGSNPDTIKKQAQKLISAQRPDGGWSQLPTLESDAYATGQSLYALHAAGALSIQNPVYEKAVTFLLATQKKDGSWLVKTRSFAAVPFVDSGFPHGDHQYISAAGTGWATIALAQTVSR